MEGEVNHYLSTIPGFSVSGVGSGPSGTPKSYSQYAWYIQNLFGWGIGMPSTGSPNALIYLKEATYPTFTVGKEIYQGSALEYKFARTVNWDDCIVTWYDTENLINTITRWRQGVWTAEGGIASAGSYKLNSELNYALPDGSGGDCSFKLTGSWPSTIKHGDFDYSQSSIKVITVHVTYDWCEEY